MAQHGFVGSFQGEDFEGQFQRFSASLRFDPAALATQFIRFSRQNLVTILCEERLALAVYNTLAFVKGDFGDQVTEAGYDRRVQTLLDNFWEGEVSTLGEAIREGRTIFANITRMVVFLLSGNLGEILAVSAAAWASGSSSPSASSRVMVDESGWKTG